MPPIILFNAYPIYSRYRTLMRTTPMQFGEDVYALQTALVEMGHNIRLDGYFGDATQVAVKLAQKRLGITVDGLAGGGTQTALCKWSAGAVEAIHHLPPDLTFGQVMHESSCRLGNYSEQRKDGSFDAGAAQRNTEHTVARVGFDVPASIEALALDERQAFDKFAGVPLTRRRWQLAAGHWNAPAYACWIAKQEGARGVPTNDTEEPGVTARAKIEEYMQSATALMKL